MLTTLQLANAIAFAVLHDGDGAPAVFRVLRANACWFCRTLEDRQARLRTPPPTIEQRTVLTETLRQVAASLDRVAAHRDMDSLGYVVASMHANAVWAAIGVLDVSIEERV